jgi:tetratricopeptide (TPR) repeat protein
VMTAMDPRPGDPAVVARLDALERAMADARSSCAVGLSARVGEVDALVTEADALHYRPVAAEARLLRATVLRKAGRLAEAEPAANDALWTAEAARDDATAARAWLEILGEAGERGDWTSLETLTGHATASVARLGDPPVLLASVLQLTGVAHTNTGKLDAASAELGRALDLRTGVFGEKHLDVARTLTALGNVARLRGDLDRALELHRRGLAIDEGILGPSHPDVARHHHNIAGVLRLQGKYEEALASYGRALDLEVAGFGERAVSVGRTHNSIGLVHLDLGDAEGALPHLELALSILGDAHHPERALALQNLGVASAMLGKHRAAVSYFDAALQAYAALPDPNDPRIEATREARVRSLHALGVARAAPVASPATSATTPPPRGANAYAPAQTWE